MFYKVNEYGGEVESRKGRKSTPKKKGGGNIIKTRRAIYTPAAEYPTICRKPISTSNINSLPTAVYQTICQQTPE